MFVSFLSHCLRLLLQTALILFASFMQVHAASHLEFPHTKITPDLPDNIKRDLSRIINYRYGTLPESNMLTTEVRSYVEPGQTYQFSPGRLDHIEKPEKVNSVSKTVITPNHTVIRGKWDQKIAEARPEANVLGKFSTFLLQHQELNIPSDEPTAEKLAYYDSILLNTGDVVKIDSPVSLPVNVVHFEKNYENGYLKLPTHGGGYYLEYHNTPHLWSHLHKDGGGYIFLGKKRVMTLII